MSWVMVLGLALVVFGVLTAVMRLPRAGWEPVGAALMLGIAGFAWQARPEQAGAPKQPAERQMASGAAAIEARKALGAETDGTGSKWTMIADGLARNGEFGAAAGVVLGAVRKDPGNADAWLALANDLVSHAEGSLSPAALYAYRRAEEADPQHPGPAFFLGLAMAQNGRLDEAQKLWADLLARAPKDAPWRADLAVRLARLDQYIASQNNAVPRR